jgi:UDP-N-acetylmuramate dehydrogenase
MIPVQYDKELKGLNTFGIAARAAGYAEFHTPEDLDAVFSDPQWKDRRWIVLGGGSNILPRGDYDGLILHPAAEGIREIGRGERTIRLRAEAGVEWDRLVALCVEQGYAGVENLSGIPGTVGAAPIQNIGAYGAEAKDTIAEVEAYLVETGEVRRFSNAECHFGYRDSIFKQAWKGRAIVIAVTFELSLNPQVCLGYGDLAAEVTALGGATLANVRRAVLAIRAAKLPDPAVLGNSGSFFKNPVVPKEQADALRASYPDLPTYPALDGVKLAAGWLIDRSGLKGYRQGRVGVDEKQALVLVNYGGASGDEVLALAHRVISTIEEKFGIRLEMEVNVL